MPGSALLLSREAWLILLGSAQQERNEIPSLVCAMSTVLHP
jgi:hypothetical protein